MRTVLVIDDEYDARVAVEWALRSEGYSVLKAEDTRSGLALVNEHRPDLVICDFRLGDGDGLELLRTLRNRPSTVDMPFILVTGVEDASLMRQGMELGADDFLRKPFTRERLLAAVEARLRRQTAYQFSGAQNQARLLSIIEATPDLAAIVQPGTLEVSYLNHAGRKMLGIRREYMGSLRFGDFFTECERRRILEEVLPQAIAQGHWTGETVLSGSDSREMPVSQQIIARAGPDGELEYLSTLARDERERRQAQLQRAEMELQLRQAQKLESIGQLAAGIAHEINTPTQYIGDNTRFLRDAFDELGQLLKQLEPLILHVRESRPDVPVLKQFEQVTGKVDLDYLREEIPKAIQQSLEGVQRVTNIVRALKEFSHPGGQEKTWVDLNHAIETTVTVARNEWKYVSEIVLHLDPGLPPVLCLPGEMNQVFLNLIINAAHAIADVVGDGSQRKGIITISTRQLDDGVEIRIQDTGTGIPEAVRERVFDPFFTTKGVGKGTGQGLAIARSVVVDKHGGRIDFETETGRGTTFRIQLPRGGAKGPRPEARP